tara:strand:- start:6211 stop:6777 length:567 start_codon:yes stop_codon:yes gene_type:complete
MSNAESGQARARVVRLLVESGIWLAIFMLMWVYSYTFERDLEIYRWGTVSWPRGVLLAIFVVATLSLLSSWRAIKRGAHLAEEFGAEHFEMERGLGATLRIAGTFLWPLLYLWLLPRAGYYITTPIFIAGYMHIFGQRNWIHLICTTVGIYVGVLLMFTVWLYVPLPTGNWPGFYDLSNAFLVMLGAL